jgi:undecaprenol kinase
MEGEIKGEVKRFKKSLKHAFDGFVYAIYHEKNFRIEIMIAIFILILIFIFKLKNWEAIVLLLMIMWVLISELINTVLERVVDILKPRIHPYARLIKDLMAAVVLISSIVAVAIGIIIFYPYFRDLIVLFGR